MTPCGVMDSGARVAHLTEREKVVCAAWAADVVRDQHDWPEIGSARRDLRGSLCEMATLNCEVGDYPGTDDARWRDLARLAKTQVARRPRDGLIGSD
jgi:hypothetical protein